MQRVICLVAVLWCLGSTELQAAERKLAIFSGGWLLTCSDPAAPSRKTCSVHKKTEIQGHPYKWVELVLKQAADGPNMLILTGPDPQQSPNGPTVSIRFGRQDGGQVQVMCNPDLCVGEKVFDASSVKTFIDQRIATVTFTSDPEAPWSINFRAGGLRAALRVLEKYR